MRIAIVTSEVTYIPDNYNKLILPLLENESVIALVNLKNRAPSLYLKGLGLVLFGAKKIGMQLIKNNFSTGKKIRINACKMENVNFIEAKSMNDETLLMQLEKLNLDLILNIRTRCIYKKTALNAARLGCINLHHGILPKYRGTMCDLYALYEKRKAGFSLHKMELKIDAGNIYATCESDYQGTDYWEYLNQSHLFELSKIKILIEQVKNLGHLPLGDQNKRDSKTVYSKNPTRRMIKEMLKKGMIL